MAQYQSGNQTRRVAALTALPSPTARCTPTWPAGIGIADGDLVAVADPPRAARSSGPVVDETIRPDTLLRAVPLGRGVQRERADRPGSGPATPGCRPSRPARPRRSHRRPGRRPPADHRQPRPAAVSSRTRDPPPPGHTGRSRSTRRPSTKGHPMPSKNRFLQGIFEFKGIGLDKPAPLDDALVLRGAGRLDRPAGVLPRRQHQRRAGRGRADADGVPDALLPDRGQGRRARAAAGGRGPDPAPRSSSTLPPPPG